MRTAPAIHVSVSRFGVWRAAVAAVLAVAWLVVGAWAVSHGRARGGLPQTRVAVAAVAAIGFASLLAARLFAVRPFELRWDGRSWFVASASGAGTVATPVDAVPGGLRPNIDLGGWLLLRFEPDRPSSSALLLPRSVPRWLPVQRSGLEPSWHALRCAVHSPRPAAAAVES